MAFSKVLISRCILGTEFCCCFIFNKWGFLSMTFNKLVLLSGWFLCTRVRFGRICRLNYHVFNYTRKYSVHPTSVKLPIL
jgi:hypothetical protein